MRIRTLLSLSALLAMIPASALAGSFFDSKAPISITVKTDLPALVNDRSKGSHSATLSGDVTRNKEIKLKIATRGMTRLQVCKFPPIKFKFDAADVAGTDFEGQRNIKLVTHCDRPDYGDSDDNDQAVILEYLIYRVHAALHDEAIRVRLAQVTYVDVTGQMRTRTRPAFLLEDMREVAERNGAEELDKDTVNNRGYSASALDSMQAHFVPVWEFFIANGDWYLTSGDTVFLLNNLPIMKQDGKIFPVPYDFDRAGLRAFRYAFNNHENGDTFDLYDDTVGNIRGIYRDYFAGSAYKPALDLLRDRQDKIREIYRNAVSEGLTPENRDRALGHIDRFFKAISTTRDDEVQSGPFQPIGHDRVELMRVLGLED